MHLRTRNIFAALQKRGSTRTLGPGGRRRRHGSEAKNRRASPSARRSQSRLSGALAFDSARFGPQPSAVGRPFLVLAFKAGSFFRQCSAKSRRVLQLSSLSSSSRLLSAQYKAKAASASAPLKHEVSSFPQAWPSGGMQASKRLALVWSGCCGRAPGPTRGL